MIDPLGPDPDNASSHPRQVAEIVSEFETPGLLSPLRPKVRHANYDSPEAIVLRTPPAEPAAKVKAATPPPKPGPTALARSVPKQQKSTFERALGMARTVLPLVGKMLPLLEGNVVSAASNLLLNHSVQEVDLKPLEESIARLQADQRALAFHTSEQKRAIRRLEDDFAALQEVRSEKRRRPGRTDRARRQTRQAHVLFHAPGCHPACRLHPVYGAALRPNRLPHSLLGYVARPT